MNNDSRSLIMNKLSKSRQARQGVLNNLVGYVVLDEDIEAKKIKKVTITLFLATGLFFVYMMNSGG